MRVPAPLRRRRCVGVSAELQAALGDRKTNRRVAEVTEGRNTERRQIVRQESASSPNCTFSLCLFSVTLCLVSFVQPHRVEAGLAFLELAVAGDPFAIAREHE